MKFDYFLTKKDYFSILKKRIRTMNIIYYIVVSYIYFYLGYSLINNHLKTLIIGFLLHIILMIIIITIFEKLFEKYVIKINDIIEKNNYGDFNFILSPKEIKYKINGAEEIILSNQIQKIKTTNNYIYIYTTKNLEVIELYKKYFEDEKKYTEVTQYFNRNFK